MSDLTCPVCDKPVAECMEADHLLAPRPAPQINVMINIIESKPPEFLNVAHPCVMGQHRWAYLTYGGIACGYCGVQRDFETGLERSATPARRVGTGKIET